MFDPFAPPLSDQQNRYAVLDKIKAYPQVVRTGIDFPITGQTSGIIAFNLLPEPKTTKNGQKILGFIKLRGNWADENMCKVKASSIVREQDSHYANRIVPVGHWIPITEDINSVSENIDVKVDESEVDTARAEAAKKNEEERNRRLREIREREEELKNTPDIHEDTTDIKYYTMKWVTWLQLQEHVETMEKRLNELKNKEIENRKILYKLDSEYPGHRERWLSVYDEARKKSGLPSFVIPEKYERIYDSDRLKLENETD